AEEHRLPPLRDDQLDGEQRRSGAELAATPRGCVFGPFAVMQRSAPVLDHCQRLGNYLRFHSVVPIKLREFTMLMTGRFWNQPYIWYVHEKVARKEGLSDHIVKSIAAGTRPAQMADDEATVHDFCFELFHERRVSDRVYQSALHLLGEKGVVE